MRNDERNKSNLMEIYRIRDTYGAREIYRDRGRNCFYKDRDIYETVD